MKRTVSLALAALAAAALLFSCAGAPASGVAPDARPEAEATVDERAREESYSADKLSAAPAPAPSVAPESGAARGSAAGAPGVAFSTGSGSAPKPMPSASGLKAGFSDDNAQFNYFVEFLAKYADVEHVGYDIGERLTLRVLDADGKPVANARVTVKAGAETVASGLTFADGGFRFYPAALGTKAKSFSVTAERGKRAATAIVARDGQRLVELRLADKRAVPSPLPLDVLFVMDTTGSMGEEIERLRATIEIIYANLSALKPAPLVRFGLVLYKDRGDEYITERVPLTSDLDAFQARLDQVTASGGGDGPEDLQSALDDAVNKMDWNKDGVRVAFVVTDAEAHLDYGRSYTYVDAANDARAKGIKLYTIGTGGLPLEGEYLLRQVSQLTDARYIFLTYGEGGESGGGSEGSVSHHTGSNFQTDKLEAIIIRFVKEEAAFQSDSPLEVDEDFFTADKIDDETRDATLDKLFAEAVGNLADYSTYRVTPDTPCVVLPLSPATEAERLVAEYFGERLAAASSEGKRWKPVERKDLQKVLAELELQLSGLVDEASAARVGGVLGADVLVTGTLYRRAERYELFLKLVRVSTAEVLAVTRAKIDLDLGL